MVIAGSVKEIAQPQTKREVGHVGNGSEIHMRVDHGVAGRRGLEFRHAVLGRRHFHFCPGIKQN